MKVGDLMREVKGRMPSLKKEDERKVDLALERCLKEISVSDLDSFWSSIKKAGIKLRAFDFKVANSILSDDPPIIAATYIDNQDEKIILVDEKILKEDTDGVFDRIFHVAHELGHIYLEHTGPTFYQYDLTEMEQEDLDRVPGEERLAEEFAYRLLLNNDKLKEAYKLYKDKGIPEKEIMMRLGKLFFCGSSHVQYRLDELRLI